jgi:hypothetical protein
MAVPLPPNVIYNKIKEGGGRPTLNAQIEIKDRPKFDWNGIGYRWVCIECNRYGGWTSKTSEARIQGEQHDAAKHSNEEE